MLQERDGDSGSVIDTRLYNYLPCSWHLHLSKSHYSFFPLSFCKNSQLSKCKSFSCNKVSVTRVYNFHFHLLRSGRNVSFVLIWESQGSTGVWRMEAHECTSFRCWSCSTWGTPQLSAGQEAESAARKGAV